MTVTDTISEFASSFELNTGIDIESSENRPSPEMPYHMPRHMHAYVCMYLIYYSTHTVQ